MVPSTLAPSFKPETLDAIIMRMNESIKSVLRDGEDDVTAKISVLDITVLQYPDPEQPHVVVGHLTSKSLLSSPERSYSCINFVWTSASLVRAWAGLTRAQLTQLSKEVSFLSAQTLALSYRCNSSLLVDLRRTPFMPSTSGLALLSDTLKDRLVAQAARLLDGIP